RWLIYLPPTMSPCETSRRPALLEHPEEAFTHFRKAGVARLICEEKHMGSRAVVIVCKGSAAAQARFGVSDEAIGMCYTRPYRRFAWPVRGLDDLRLAPFHLLASEERVHVDKTHAWHLEQLGLLCAADPSLLQTTRACPVELGNRESEGAGIRFWEELTAAG